MQKPSHQKLIEEAPGPPSWIPKVRDTFARYRRHCRASGEVYECRHARVSRSSGRRRVLHGDEHPHTGRASGHRDGVRRRSRASEQIPRSPAGEPLGHSTQKPIYSPHGHVRSKCADQCRRSGTNNFSPAAGTLTRSRAFPGGSRRARRYARVFRRPSRCRRSTIRCWPRSSWLGRDARIEAIDAHGSAALGGNAHRRRENDGRVLLREIMRNDPTFQRGRPRRSTGCRATFASGTRRGADRPRRTNRITRRFARELALQTLCHGTEVGKRAPDEMPSVKRRARIDGDNDGRAFMQAISCYGTIEFMPDESDATDRTAARGLDARTFADDRSHRAAHERLRVDAIVPETPHAGRDQRGRRAREESSRPKIRAAFRSNGVLSSVALLTKADPWRVAPPGPARAAARVNRRRRRNSGSGSSGASSAPCRSSVGSSRSYSIGAGVVAGPCGYSYSRNLPDINRMADYQPSRSTRVFARDGSQLLANAVQTENRIWIPIAQIPVPVRNAFIATEDQHFYQHHGVDFGGIAARGYRRLAPRAISGRVDDHAATRPARCFSRAKCRVARKVQEALLAIEIERYYTKGRNPRALSQSSFTSVPARMVFEAAAHTYFGTERGAADDRRKPPCSPACRPRRRTTRRS